MRAVSLAIVASLLGAFAASSVLSQPSQKPKAIIVGPNDPLPPNTLKCADFEKRGDVWVVIRDTNFDLANGKRDLAAGSRFNFRALFVSTPSGSYDLYSILERKCTAASSK